MLDLEVITIRKSDSEIEQFIRSVLFHRVTIFVVFFTAIYVVFVGTTIYSGLPFWDQIAINLVWAMVYYLYMIVVAPKATIYIIDRRIPFFFGIWALLFVPCFTENVVGAIWLELDRNPVAVLANTLKNLMYMAPGLALLLALLSQKFERGVFIVPPKRFVWFRWEDRQVLGKYNSARAPLRLKAQNQYCLIYRKNEAPEMERISLTQAIEKYCFKIEGMRVHRSHWLALSQIEYVRYVDGNPRVYLKSGEAVPANRKSYEALKEYCEAQGVLARERELTNSHQTMKPVSSNACNDLLSVDN